jgi:hypothetical protein
MRKLVIAVGILVSVGAVAAAAKALPHPAMKQDDLKWGQPFGPEGPSIALVEGTFGNGRPASFFVKFTSGGASPWHFHNHDYEGVTLKGTFTEQQKGEAVVELPAGTWFSQPAKQVHQNTCLKGDDCLVFVHFDKGADSIITDEEGKPVPPPQKDAAANKKPADKRGL